MEYTKEKDTSLRVHRAIPGLFDSRDGKLLYIRHEFDFKTKKEGVNNIFLHEKPVFTYDVLQNCELSYPWK